MIPVQEILNKIKWTGKPEEHTLGIYDRKENKIIKIPMKNIASIDKTFMLIKQEGIEKEIPLHRIRKIWKGEQLIWER